MFKKDRQIFIGLWFISIILILFLSIFSCVEEIDFVSDSEIENTVVVEARLTDKIEKQSIFLSEVFNFQEATLKPITNATIELADDLGDIIPFMETEAGIYTSVDDLRLEHDRKYQLKIRTYKGQQFSSMPERLPNSIEINSIDLIKSRSDSGLEGISVLINADPASEETAYLRFEYEEDYQVIAPEYNGVDWDEVDYDYFMNDEDGWEATVKQASEESRVCYSKNYSKQIILESTERFNKNYLKDFEIRFLSKDNYIISHRYGILVKQYRLSPDAYNFYQTLNEFSRLGSLFSTVQTGALENNFIVDNPSLKIIGFFDLSSYTEKRIFFNYEDFFPNESLPPYPINCDQIGKPALYPEGFHVTFVNGELVIDGASNSPLLDGIQAGLIGYYAHNPDYEAGSTDEDPERAPYLTKRLGCIDCRAMGSNKRPEFWVD